MRLLRTTFAERLVRAFAPEDVGVVFADPDQLPLFPRAIGDIRTVLTRLTPIA